ncbi:malate synthase G [Croceicoccus sp. YJ47]|uniref:malate synthase G n=1 Tax=Croceicoccus sp. YJ47 TaxID=2798724 RepID=UPI001920F735|nr:malate synthase G [Croceicoccus sp. YJ47]QQN73761.1 malate synthase G [Croceicoccus sp. YJ47]
MTQQDTIERTGTNGERVSRAGLDVAAGLAEFVETRALAGTGIDADAFWQRFAAMLGELAPVNRRLLDRRDTLQQAIDEWHAARSGKPIDTQEYMQFLREIGYLVEEPAPFAVDTENVDPEIATMAGPQLVVPVLNERFVLNAANARWGSLYDAFYGTDALPGTPEPGGYDEARGAKVIAAGRAFLDETVPLREGSWADWDGREPLLREGELRGRRGDGWLLRHNGLHIEIVVDRDHPIYRTDRAGIADIVMEAAITTIVDMEDLIAAVDAEDKVAAYANWLGLMRGELTAHFRKGGKDARRTLAADRDYTGPDGAFTLPGRSVLFVRNVGHLMTNPAIRLPDGSDVPEGLMDAAITGLCSLHDLKRLGNPAIANSRTGSIYIVKPKMHGPEEAAFTNRLFDAVENMLNLPRHTMKVGVMDEERRTSANLAACIAAVRHRIVFINTGFLDRTGDEIHTAMRAGPMVPKGEMKASEWIDAYEKRNVAIGLACGLDGKAQIGKGMWAMPDRMADMLEAKIAHPMTGANTAWVPSPTAATLHAIHYHRVDVFERREHIASEGIPPLETLLRVPLADGRNWTEDEIARELDNNAQGILGYVVRWIDQGVGCSKVPDIHDIGLMEDRATLRISSQALANWLMHGVCSEADVDAALRRMAAKVDAQNAGDPFYEPMVGHWDSSHAYRAARALIFEGAAQPSGYTEPLLHAWRLRKKAEAA